MLESSKDTKVFIDKFGSWWFSLSVTFFVSSSVRILKCYLINLVLGGSAGLSRFFVSSSVRILKLLEIIHHNTNVLEFIQPK